MPESNLVNMSKLNQKAKEFLKDNKEYRDPSQPYCLQLARWALDKGELSVTDSRLSETLDWLLGRKPREAMDYLELAEDGEKYDVVPEKQLEEMKEPADLAWAVLDTLDSKIGIRIPDYPSVRSHP
jgi:hypothetical protein